jgi:hypothetical protein
MKICSLKVLRGPNQWASFPVLEALVDLGPLEDFPSHTLPGFNDRLMAWLPTMIEHRCTIGERGGLAWADECNAALVEKSAFERAGDRLAFTVDHQAVAHMKYSAAIVPPSTAATDAIW